MKTETKYICETCGSKYDNEKAALACERSHVKVERVTDVNYDGCTYPYYLKVKISDGVVKRYVLDN